MAKELDFWSLMVFFGLIFMMVILAYRGVKKMKAGKTKKQPVKKPFKVKPEKVESNPENEETDKVYKIYICPEVN